MTPILAAGLGTHKRPPWGIFRHGPRRFRGAVSGARGARGPDDRPRWRHWSRAKRHAAFLEVFDGAGAGSAGPEPLPVGPRDPEEAALRAQARSLGLDARVRFNGLSRRTWSGGSRRPILLRSAVHAGGPAPGRGPVCRRPAKNRSWSLHLEGASRRIVENGVKTAFVVGRDDFGSHGVRRRQVAPTNPELALRHVASSAGARPVVLVGRADGTGDRPDPAGHPAAKGGDASHRAKPSGDP